MACSLDAQEDGDKPTAAHCRQSVYRYPQGPIEEQHSTFFDCSLDLLPSQSLSAVLNSPIMSEKATAVTHAPTQDQPPDTVPYSIFTRGEKRWIVFLVAYARLFSPLSGFIYYPALYNLAHDLEITLTMANLSITTYMLVSGIAPSILGDMADTMGRRPLFLFAILIYTIVNVGLAVQRSYPALLVLRMLQSAGSSREYMRIFLPKWFC